MGRMNGRVALVTGAAQGIGFGIASVLAREGARVVVADVRADTGSAAAAELTDAGGQASYLELDVTSEAAWQSGVREVQEAHGGLHVLVNNAGLALQRNVVETTYDEWRRVQSVNLDGVFLGLKHAIPAIAAAGGGSIVNISSVEGIVADPDMAAYDASKGGVRLLTKSAALHCGRERNGVRVNSVHPSFVRGPLTDAWLQEQPDPAAAYDALVAAHPIGFLGEPEDIGNGVLYLACEESRWVTGAELVIDGGWTAM